MNTHVGRLADRFERPGIIAADRRSGTDPGHEPALDGFGGGGDVDRRGVSLRWLGASVLTALTGAALIGGAIYVALQGETTFAELPEHVTAQAPRGPGEDKATAARKGDKLVRSEVVAVAKQAFRAPVTIRVGDREVIKVRPFVRIATNLSLTSGLYATDIPPFNPLRLFSEENNEKVIAEAAPEVADAEVSVVKRDLSAATVEPSPAGLSDEDVAAQIEEERRTAAEAGRRPALPLPAQLLLSRTLRQPDALPDALGIRQADRVALQLDRGARHPGERDDAAEARAARRRQPVRGARRRPEAQRGLRGGAEGQRRAPRPRSAASSTRSAAGRRRRRSSRGSGCASSSGRACAPASRARSCG